MPYYFRLLLYSVLLWFNMPVMADPAIRYAFSYYRIQNGLSDEFVHSTYKDSYGFLWVCTTNGLDRFDGNRFIHYQSSASNLAQRIRSNSISHVAEGKGNLLWCVSDAGLMRIKLTDGSIDFLDDVTCDNAYYLSQPIQSLLVDDDGSLWLGQYEGLLHVILDAEGKITKIVRHYVHGVISTICKQGQFVWVGGTKGLSCFLNARRIDAHPQLEGIQQVTSIKSQGDYLWIGTRQGLHCYHTLTKQDIWFKHDPANPNSLSSDLVTSIAFNSSGEPFIGTQRGLNIYTADRHFEQIDEGTPFHALNTNEVTDVYIDNQDCIWVGTMVGGLNLLAPKRIMFNYKLIGTAEDKNVVNRLFQDNEGNLWAAVMNKGLAVRKRGMPDFEFLSNAGSAGTLPDNNILGIRQDALGDYWIATRSSGLVMLKHEDIANRRYKAFTTQNSGISSNTVFDIVVDSKRNGLWLCNGMGIDFMDLETCQFHNLETSIDVSTMMPYVMYMDRKDRLWIGGNGLGVVFLTMKDAHSGQYLSKYYRYKLDEPESRIQERISTILETDDGEIYLGSQCNGLFRCMGTNGHQQLEGTDGDEFGEFRFCHIPMNFGQFCNKVSKLLEDKEHRIWVSSLDGLYVYDPATELSVKLNNEDGLPLDQFYVRSGRRLADGRLCFGTMNGLLELSSDIAHRGGTSADEGKHRETVISYVMVNDSMIVGSQIQEVHLYPGDRILEIGFSALDYVTPEKVVYGYQLEGVDEEWTVEARERRVRYANLPPGDYVLRVRCTNDSNAWSAQTASLKIFVHPPFYQTLWFYLIVFGLFMALAAGVLLWYFRQQKEIQHRLSEEVAARTHELALTMEKANSEKLALYTNLTHELKTPLTLILGPTKELEEQNKDSRLSDGIQMISRNTRYLLSLVEQIMDMRAIDSNQLMLKEVPIDIVALFDECLSNFERIIDKRAITLERLARIASPYILSDKEALHKIIYNIVSNAVKYSPNGGHITTRLAQWHRGDDEMVLYFSVTNTGSYISAKEQTHIFDCFYKISGQKCYGQTSSGIGLYLVKQLVDALKGTISVKSSMERGTSFRLCIPVRIASTAEHADNTESGQGSLIDHEMQDIPFVPSEDGRPILLLVEDNEDMRNYIKGFLLEKYQIGEAANGKQGYELAQKIEPDFIISDLMMPEWDGLVLCEHIRRDSRLSHVPFLMLTALSSDDARLNSYKSGVDAFLTKPFDKQMLLMRIENIMHNRRQLQEELSRDLTVAGAHVEIEGADKIFMNLLADTMKAKFANADFGTSELVKAMGMSSTSLYKKITSLTGLSASQYIRLYRLQTAKKLMVSQGKNSGLSVSEVAYKVGFNDPKYFTRCFVKQYGIQPSSLLV